MPAKPESTPVTIVGAGLVGSVLATLLARRGYQVRTYERRPDMRREPVGGGRSVNLAVSVRGLHILEQLGLDRAVLAKAVPMPGRMIHSVDGVLTFQRYGRDDSECIHSISRAELNKFLLTAAEQAGAEIVFSHKATSLELSSGGSLLFHDEKSGSEVSVETPLVIGTDGSASVVRESIARATGGQVSQVPLNYGYKELVIPAGPAGSFKLHKNALHIWPRGTYMLIALPNEDGSFTCTLFLPHEGALSFASLQTPDQVRELFQAQFRDVLDLIPGLCDDFFTNPTGHMVTVKCTNWHAGDRALLLGDAAHAIVPFFGQGMNCGFEDCSVFAELLGAGTTEQAFERLERSRKPNADAIADMAVENFVEMRDKVGDARFQLEKGVERLLQERFPGQYVSRYSLVSFSRVPYRFAYDVGLVQAEMLRELCQGISKPEQVDLDRASVLIRQRLAPLFEQSKKGTYGS